MGQPRNPNVRVDFDSADDQAAVGALGIDVTDAFVFAFAEQEPGADCKQIKTAVLTQTEAEFDRLLPVARAAALAIPDPIVQHVENPDKIFLEDCCLFSRDVQVIALAGPNHVAPASLRSVQRSLQSVVITEDDRNKDPLLRHIRRLRITPERINKDCTQL